MLLGGLGLLPAGRMMLAALHLTAHPSNYVSAYLRFGLSIACGRAWKKARQAVRNIHTRSIVFAGKPQQNQLTERHEFVTRRVSLRLTFAAFMPDI
mgnify:CR=1 FL=1